jgi:hypothetical protein
LLVLSSYSYAVLRDHVQRVVDRCEAETWPEVCANLQRYFQWEYEDYSASGDS